MELLCAWLVLTNSPAHFVRVESANQTYPKESDDVLASRAWLAGSRALGEAAGTSETLAAVVVTPAPSTRPEKRARRPLRPRADRDLAA